MESSSPENQAKPRAKVEKKVKPWSRLKKDLLDREQESRSRLINIGTGALLGLRLFNYADLRAIELPDLATVLVPAASVGLIVYSEVRKRRGRTEMHDEEAGFGAREMVYRGKKPLTVEGITIGKGDNVLYVKLPRVSFDQDSLQTAEATEDLTRYAVEQIAKSGPKHIKAVCVDFEPDLPGLETFSFGDKAATPAKNLVDGKHVALQNPEKPLVILTPEEFEELTTTPLDLLTRAVEALGSERVLTYLKLAKTSPAKNERSNAVELLGKSLSTILATEVSAHFNGPEIIATKSGQDYEPGRTKIYRSLQIRKGYGGFLYAQFTDSSGSATQVPMSKLLQIKDMSLEEVLTSYAPHKRGQIAYLALEMLNKIEPEELFREKVLEREEILERLKLLGGRVQTKVETKPAKKEAGAWFGQASVISNRLRPLAVMVALFAGTNSTHLSYKDLPSLGIDLGPRVERSLDFFNSREARAQNPQTSQVEVTGKVPKDSLDWLIRGRARSGYWTLSTSHEFKNGEWIINTEREKELSLPEFDFDSENVDEGSTDLTGYFNLSPLQKTTSLKIPILSGMKVSKIGIKDFPNKNVQHKDILNASYLPLRIWRLTDGTIEVEVNNELFRNKTILIGVTLTPKNDRNDGVHAPVELKPINVNLLNKDALSQLPEVDSAGRRIYTSTTGGNIAENHTYSLVSDKKDEINNAKTPEEMVNAIASDKNCFCETCNTELVLLNSIKQYEEQGEPSLNMAFGYIQGLQHYNPSSSLGEVLRGAAMHAYGIDDRGETSDATPKIVSNDPVTQKYVKLLGTSASVDEFINQALDSMDNQRTMVTLEVLAAMLVGSSAYFAMRRGPGFMRRVTNKDNIKNAIDDEVLRVYSTEDIKSAYRFFSALSWSRPGSESGAGSTALGNKNKKGLLRDLVASVNYERLTKYLENPEEYEGADWTGVTRLKYRLLAKYLMI